MTGFEYKVIFISTLGAYSSEEVSEKIERHLSIEGAKGWEIVNVQNAHKEIEDDCGIRCIFKRPMESILQPYLSSGYTDEQLDAMYIYTAPSTRNNRPLTVDDLNYFLENAKDYFDEDPKCIVTFWCALRDGKERCEAIEEIKKFRL